MAESPTSDLMDALKRESEDVPAATTTAVKKPKMRNYHQMGTGKLRGCVAELRARSGDAYDRCVGKGCDPAEDLRVAEAELAKR